MFGLLTLLVGFGSGVMDSQRRDDERNRAKREGKPYYFHKGKCFATDNNEPVSFSGILVKGKYTGRIFSNSPTPEQRLREANEECKKRGLAYHYEENPGGYHNRRGWIKIENSTGLPVKVSETLFRFKPYWIYNCDRETGEPIGEFREVDSSEASKYFNLLSVGGSYTD